MNPFEDRDPVFRLVNDLLALPLEPLGDHLSEADAFRYVSGTSSAEEESHHDRHLASCEECLNRVETALVAHEASVASQHVSEEQRICDRSDEIRRLLKENVALEQGYDYVVPSGDHVGIHVNLGRLCWSEAALDRLALLLARELRRVSFDAILTHGWPMATVARRLASCYFSRPLRLIESEGYKSPVLSRSVQDGHSVVVLLDVVVSGGLARQLTSRVRRAGSRVATTMAVVGASDASYEHSIEALCTMPLEVVHHERDCPRCGVLERRVFNTFSSRMTVRKTVSKSPEDLFNTDPAVAALWSALYIAGAYDKHRIDRRKFHYNGFVDTQRLINNPITGISLVDGLVNTVLAEAGRAPDTILVPQRSRGRQLGSRLVDAFCARTGSVSRVRSVPVREGRAFLNQEWQREIRGHFVLVCDSAAASGDTLDGICHAAIRAGATVGAAVLMSRLKETCEEALSARLDGRFWKLFYFPTPFFEVDKTDRSACPTCALKRRVHELASRINNAYLIALSESLEEHGQGPRPTAPAHRLEPGTVEQLLQKCERRIAGGLALHTFATAMNDGMAPLDLPLDSKLPATKRAAMLEALPSGVVNWSGEAFEKKVLACLENTSPPQLWLAAANLLAREGRYDWVDRLGRFLAQNDEPLPAHFWGWVTFNLCSQVEADRTAVRPIKDSLQQALRMSAESGSRSQLKEVMKAIDELNDRETSVGGLLA